jgi:hypothetical protein
MQKIQWAIGQKTFVFSHPDFTVGTGIAPVRAISGLRTLPPMWNFTNPRKTFIYLTNNPGEQILSTGVRLLKCVNQLYSD